MTTQPDLRHQVIDPATATEVDLMPATMCPGSADDDGSTMATRRRLELIGEDQADVLTDVLDTARAAATAGLDQAMVGFYEQAEGAHPRPRTGTKMARIVGAAGCTAAHLLRLQAMDATPQPWDAALIKDGPALSSWDWDERMQAALNLRATFRHLDNPPQDPALRSTRLVAAWLTHTSGDGLVDAGARLAQHALDQRAPDQAWATAWYVVNGLTLLDIVRPELPATLPRGPHQPPRSKQLIDLIRRTCLALGSADIITISDLVTRARITRPTYYKWTGTQ